MRGVLALPVASGLAYDPGCTPRTDVLNGSTPLVDALHGYTVKVTMLDYNNSLSNYNSATDTWTGLLPSLLDAIAAKGKFTLDRKYALAGGFSGTYTDFLVAEFNQSTDVVGDFTSLFSFSNRTH